MNQRAPSASFKNRLHEEYGHRQRSGAGVFNKTADLGSNMKHHRVQRSRRAKSTEFGGYYWDNLVDGVTVKTNQNEKSRWAITLTLGGAPRKARPVSDVRFLRNEASCSSVGGLLSCSSALTKASFFLNRWRRDSMLALHSCPYFCYHGCCCCSDGGDIGRIGGISVTVS